MIVNCCGFDSIPSDLGALMMVRHMQNKYQRDCAELKYLIGPMQGGASGGTLASAMGLMEMPSHVLKQSRDPFYLNDGGKRGVPQKDFMSVKYDNEVQHWIAPFVMGTCNTRVVRRSNSLLDKDYGPNFQYMEAVSCSSWFMAAIMWIGLAAFMLLGSIPFTRNLIKKYGPQPGDGPTEKQRNEGFFKITFVGKTDPKDQGEKGIEVRGQVNGHSDPGYQETSKMISETAIGLALKATREPNSIRGGILTPATSLGTDLIDRLKTAGMTFEITKP